MTPRAALAAGLAAWLGAPRLAAAPAESPAETPAPSTVSGLAGSVTIPAGERITRERWIQTGTLEFAGEAEDDLFFLAGAATLSGTFADDVFGFALQSLEFTGVGREDLRLAGTRSVVFNGAAERNLTLWGPAVELSTNGVVRGDAMLSGTSVTCTGRVEGNLTLEGAESATLKGVVLGTVFVRSPDVVILPGTEIGGDLVMAGPLEAALPSGVRLGGKIRNEGAEPGAWSTLQTRFALLVMMYVIFTGFLLLVLQLAVAPLSTQIAAQLLRVSWLQCVVSGALAVGVGGVLALAGIRLGLGAGFSALLLAALLLLLFAGQSALALSIGHRMFGRRPLKSWPALLGVSCLGWVLLQALLFIPGIGFPLWLALNFQGAGAIFAHIRQTQRGSALAVYQPSDSPTPPPNSPTGENK